MNAKLWQSRFREYMELRNWSERTIYAYTSEVRRFMRFLEERGIRMPNAINRDALEAYRAGLFEQQAAGHPVTVRTVAARLTAAKAFCRYLAHEQFILVDPGVDVELPRVPKLLPRPILTQAQVAALMETPDVGTPIGLRDRAALELLYATAIRNSELGALDCADIDLQARELRVRSGKGARERLVPLGEEAALWMDLYLRHGRDRLAGNIHETRVFVTWRGRPLTREDACRIVARAGEKTGLPRRITPHLIRHCCASHMLENGASVRHVQHLLGHECIESTVRYTHILIGDLREVHRRCHPRERRSV